jgi:heme a synthase
VNIPRPLRALLRLSFALALLHIWFGAIVRISGSGMGCGDHWPKCQGAWFPPFDQPTLVIEWTHRLLAALVLATVLVTAIVAWRARASEGVGGRGGVLPPTLTALALVVATALLGAVTVWMHTLWLSTVLHLLLAAALLAALVTALVRAGDFGATRRESGTAKLFRGTVAAAGLALAVLLFGGLTAKVPGANMICPKFPLCGAEGGAPIVERLVLLQMTHRVLAILLFFHLFGLTMASRKLKDAPAAVRALRTSFALTLLQVLIAGAMIGMRFPPALRSLHQLVGVLIWVAIVVTVLLARRSAPAESEVPPSMAVLIARGGGA